MFGNKVSYIQVLHISPHNWLKATWQSTFCIFLLQIQMISSYKFLDVDLQASLFCIFGINVLSRVQIVQVAGWELLSCIMFTSLNQRPTDIRSFDPTDVCGSRHLAWRLKAPSWCAMKCLKSLFYTITLVDLSSSATRTCFDDAIPLGNRTNITLDGLSMPIGTWELKWDSASLVTRIFEILASEKLGFHVENLGGHSSSTPVAYMLGGCSTWNPKPENVRRECVHARRFHFAFESWQAGSAMRVLFWRILGLRGATLIILSIFSGGVGPSDGIKFGGARPAPWARIPHGTSALLLLL